MLAAGIIQVDDTITKQTERVDNAHAQREAMSDDVVQEHIKIVTEGEAHFAAISTTLKCRDFIRARKGEKFPVAKGRALITQQAYGVSKKSRFDEYVQTSQRIKSDEHRNAPCWKFMSHSWHDLSAIAAAHGHVGLNADRVIATRDCNESPLVSAAGGGTFTPVHGGDDSIGAMQGTYLHFCELLERWIRSGPTSGQEDRGFAPRNKEHAAGAELRNETSLKSNFYVSYRTEAARQRAETTQTLLPQAKGQAAAVRRRRLRARGERVHHHAATTGSGNPAASSSRGDDGEG